MAITQHAGNIPHIKWLDLKNNNILVECAILKEDGFGNMYYIEVPNLDQIDKQRLVRILTNRNASNFELWDLMSQITLNNGMNALEYFHQVVKVITPTGVIMNPKVGAIGVGTGAVDLKTPGEAAPDVIPVQEAVTTQQEANAPIAKNVASSSPTKGKPGRPAKAK